MGFLLFYSFMTQYVAVLIDHSFHQNVLFEFLQIILASCNKDRIGVLSFSVIVFLFVLPHAVHTYLQWTENISKGPFTYFLSPCVFTRFVKFRVHSFGIGCWMRRIFIIKIIQHKNDYFLTFPACF